MKSMTGYGFQELSNDKIHISLEIKSYNNRYLDVFVNLPPFLNPLEPRIREYLSSRSKRGRLEFSLRIRELEEDIKILLDSRTASAYREALVELGKTVDISEPLRLEHFLQLDGVLKSDKNRDIEKYWDTILPLVDAAFVEFEESRLREGKHTQSDIEAQLALLEENLAIVKNHAPKLEEHIKTNIRDRIFEMVGDKIDETKVLSETAVLLVKYSVNEELARMDAHIKEFRVIIKKQGPMGKKLDFLCQELNREINTTGSKSIILEISQAVVQMKDALENIREQLRNIE